MPVQPHTPSNPNQQLRNPASQISVHADTLGLTAESFMLQETKRYPAELLLMQARVRECSVTPSRHKVALRGTRQI